MELDGELGRFSAETTSTHLQMVGLQVLSSFIPWGKADLIFSELCVMFSFSRVVVNVMSIMNWKRGSKVQSAV